MQAERSEFQRTYYPLWFRLDGVDRYLIWYGLHDAPYDGDGVVLDCEGRVPAFGDLESLRAYAARYGLTLEDETPSLHDLDRVQHWLALRGKAARKRTRRRTIHCNEFLAAWNLFSDVRSSLFPAWDKRLGGARWRVYDKLFWGCNLPAVTPPGCRYWPKWGNAEVAVLRRVLGSGLRVFRQRVVAA